MIRKENKGTQQENIGDDNIAILQRPVGAAPHDIRTPTLINHTSHRAHIAPLTARSPQLLRRVRDQVVHLLVAEARLVVQHGEVVDVGMWLRKGKKFEEEKESDDAKAALVEHDAEEEAKVGINPICNTCPLFNENVTYRKHQLNNLRSSSRQRLRFSSLAAFSLWIWMASTMVERLKRLLRS